MNRRHFFRNLSIATAAIYLRISPSLVRDVPVGWEINDYFASSVEWFHDRIVHYIIESSPYTALLAEKTFR